MCPPFRIPCGGSYPSLESLVHSLMEHPHAVLNTTANDWERGSSCLDHVREALEISDFANTIAPINATDIAPQHFPIVHGCICEACAASLAASILWPPLIHDYNRAITERVLNTANALFNVTQEAAVLGHRYRNAAKSWDDTVANITVHARLEALASKGTLSGFPEFE